MKKSVKTSALLSFAILAACGKVGDLEPRAASKPIPTAYGNDKPASADELVTASAQARPGRSVELLRRSERREDDPFDVPPGTEPVALDIPDLGAPDKATGQSPEPAPNNR
jgi:hypothetical protein